MSTFWDREVVEKQHVVWMAIPRVRLYLNQRIAGGGNLYGLSNCWNYFFAGALSIEDLVSVAGRANSNGS